MSNSAVVVFDGSDRRPGQCVYVHWNGSRRTIEPLLFCMRSIAGCVDPWPEYQPTEHMCKLWGNCEYGLIEVGDTAHGFGANAAYFVNAALSLEGVFALGGDGRMAEQKALAPLSEETIGESVALIMACQSPADIARFNYATGFLWSASIFRYQGTAYTEEIERNHRRDGKQPADVSAGILA